MMDFKKSVIRKPWGYEYLVYENKDVGLWALHIYHNSKTSLHCHPNKDTGIIVIDGSVEVSFLNDSYILNEFSKLYIRKGLFHSTKSLANSESIILEIESPKEKEDLIRFDDEYGRELQPYETVREQRTTECWIDELNTLAKIGSKTIAIESTNSIEELYTHPDNKLYIVLSGGIVHGETYITKPGNVVTGKIIKLILNKFKLSPIGVTYATIR